MEGVGLGLGLIKVLTWYLLDENGWVAVFVIVVGLASNDGVYCTSMFFLKNAKRTVVAEF